MDINRVKLMLSGQGETNRRADSNAVCVSVLEFALRGLESDF